MTKLTSRLILAIHRSTLPDKALVSAIDGAAMKAAPVTVEASGDGLLPGDKKPSGSRRKYNRRDMKAEG